MNADLQSFFDAVANATAFDQVQGGLVPLPSSAASELHSLIVNCYVRSAEVPQETGELVEWCRKQTLTSLQQASRFFSSKDLSKLAIVIYEREDNRLGERIYFANTTLELIDHVSTGDMHHVIEHEGSRIESVQAFLESDREGRSRRD